MDIPATEMAENTGTLSRDVSLTGSQQIPRIRQAQNAHKTQKLMIPTKSAQLMAAKRDAIEAFMMTNLKRNLEEVLTIISIGAESSDGTFIE